MLENSASKKECKALSQNFRPDQCPVLFQADELHRPDAVPLMQTDNIPSKMIGI